MPKEKMPDVIVLLPGLMGSVLTQVKNGKKEDLWEPSIGAALSAMFSGSDRYEKLYLKEDPLDRDILDDGIVASRVMPNVHLIPGFWKIDGYTTISNYIQKNFEVTKDENFFEFAYDWRRDNRVSAWKLDVSIKTWLKKWREKRPENKNAKVILIGHSMGGIVARHYLEVRNGWEHTKALVTFGTPYRGSLNALDVLVNGSRKGPLKLNAMTELARSTTSVYQLLPIYKCYDAGDGKLVRITEADVPLINAARAKAAREFHDEIQNAVKGHQSIPEYKQFHIRPIVGIDQRTNLSARKSGNGVEILQTYEGEDHSGDGTVARVSATPYELSEEQNEIYAGTKHGSLQNSDENLRQLEGILSKLYLHLGGFLAPQPPTEVARLGLEVQDVYWTTEEVECRITAPSEDLKLDLSVEGVALNPLRARWSDDGYYVANLGRLQEGAYRVRVGGDTGIEPVSDVFCVTPGHH